MPGRKHCSRKEEAIILKVLSFFEEEKHYPQRRLGTQHARKRTAKATGVSVRTLQRLANRSQEAGTAALPDTRGRRKVVVSDFIRSVVRRKVHSFYKKKEHPTLDKVFALCKEEIEDFPAMGRTTFWKLLRSLGFRYIKTQGNTKEMMERKDIVDWRGKLKRETNEAFFYILNVLYENNYYSILTY